jgi:hypothetical protein
MASDDFGIVVGINSYPGIGKLEGPEADANDFYEWLTSTRGGDVTNVKKIVSSDYSSDRKPTDEIAQEFDNLQGEAFRSGFAQRIGRRLYVYVAGHGAGLPFQHDPERSDAALLLADATQVNATHVMTKVRALYFLNAGIFDEIAVFMDCCRQTLSLNPNYPNYLNANAIGLLQNQPRKFFAFATKWGLKTREKSFNGVVRGVFTVALMKGLRGAAADTNGTITSNSLRDYLLMSMKDQLDETELNNPAIPKEPDVPPQSVNLVFAANDPVRVKVTINIPPPAANQNITVSDGQLRTIATGTTGAGPTWEVPTLLEKGLYVVEVPGLNLEQTFRVVGDEGTKNVDL